ncbi:MAG TPA: sigma-54 dependent transcriptional regulator, partial [Casimicrobiaceae bacterium]|nr:sigma-54 dependent transcriptional regulator [Casimicrobiaceae bacterium]
MSHAVLIVEDEVTFAKNLAAFLSRNGYDVCRVESAEEGLAQLADFRPEVLLLDFNLPGMNGLEMMAELKRRDSRVKIIVMTGHGSEEVAVNAMKAGAFDYLTKPVALGKLKILLDKAVGQERLEDELAYYRQRAASGSDIDSLIGESQPMVALRAKIRQTLAAESTLVDADPAAVLITGETGTGKELVARALHFEGPRRDRPFVEFNCSAIPLHLVEAELFGYERGAFTDAKQRKPGLIETADGGTLFLDEIGDIDMSLQVKLLTLLENKMVRRLGSVRENRANVRIITATNKALEAMVREGKFRSDLFFRLRIVHLELPPLRVRGDDVVLLAQHFLQLHANRYRKPGLRFTDDALALMRRHRWPGNVRELRNLVEQCVIMARGTEIGTEHLHLEAPDAADDAPTVAESQPLPEEGVNLAKMERELVTRALGQANWNVTQAARLLGISRDTLRYRMEKLQLD